ncbi:hypothetical protein IFM89_031854 [Coptis chinensis]|uniref:WRKY domain-containing protein n=1 Tax=Coptis chinensis TaxID=261450 RepID=A0A835LFR3_9MAGN|nr:hypothetical protein IFM89_031854 [Coptis chinensis]
MVFVEAALLKGIIVFIGEWGSTVVGHCRICWICFYWDVCACYGKDRVELLVLLSHAVYVLMHGRFLGEDREENSICRDKELQFQQTELSFALYGLGPVNVCRGHGRMDIDGGNMARRLPLFGRCRSYYRCTSQKCTVKKRVEISFQNPSILITTYEEGNITTIARKHVLRGNASRLLANPMFTSTPGGPSFHQELLMQLICSKGHGAWSNAATSYGHKNK